MINLFRGGSTRWFRLIFLCEGWRLYAITFAMLS